ncbi:YrrS family protein [Halobacillus sp. MO56]
MANNNDKYTRATRRQKKKKGNRMITWLVGVAGTMILLLIVFFTVMVNLGDDQASVEEDNSITLKEQYKKDEKEEAQDSSEQKAEEEQDKDSDNNADKSDRSDQEESEENTVSDKEKEKEKAEKEKEKAEKEDEDKEKDKEEANVQESDKPNVDKVITKNWSPVPTEQENHTRVTFEEGTQDWKEMTSAVAKGAGLSKSDMILWWADGNGPNSVIATVTNKDQTKNYRVYVSWVDGAGYKPTKVEVLHKNDQKR